MHEIRFSLNISAEKFREYYSGAKRYVHVVDHNGRRIQFPALNLRPFLAHDGIHGTFRLLYNDQHKLLRIERL
jgi:hypothetical protein